MVRCWSSSVSMLRRAHLLSVSLHCDSCAHLICTAFHLR